MVSLSPTGEFRLSCHHYLQLTSSDSAYELQEPSSTFYSPSTRPTLTSRLNTLTSNVRSELQRQGFTPNRIKTERMLNMRFEGTDTSLMVLPQDTDGDGEEDFEAAFRRVYKAEFGFLLEGQSVSVDDIKVSCGRVFHRWCNVHLSI
jgi:5-oxoprolinase (ATP-hydrolysing)